MTLLDGEDAFERLTCNIFEKLSTSRELTTWNLLSGESRPG